MSVASLFQRGVSLHPDRLCLVDGSLSKTYRQVDRSSDAIAAQLQTSRLGAAHCAVYASNSALALECILGIFKAGAVFVPVNSKNHVRENAELVEQFDVEVIFYDIRFAAEVALVQERCPAVQTFICINGQPADGLALEDWIQDPAAKPDTGASEDKERVVSIYSTGGTTGRPKGVMFTPRTWQAMAECYFPHVPRNGPANYLIVSPITHAAGTIGLLMLGVGATLFIHDGFQAEAVLNEIERSRITHLYLPPTAIYMLLDRADLYGRDFSSMQAFIYTSAPMSAERLKECIAIFGSVMVQYWGQTEAPIFCTCLEPAMHALEEGETHRLSSCGQRTLFTEVAVMSPKGDLLKPGERGELVVRGDLVMKGYYKNEKATAEVGAFGWHHTGDVGVIDDDGYVYIVDRLKEMIITGGFNVYPAEVEAVLMKHPSIKNCAVVGVPDEKWGEAVRALVELRAGQSISPDDIVGFCKSQLGSVKAPKVVEIVDELPRTSVGKIAKKEIRARYWKDGRVI